MLKTEPAFELYGIVDFTFRIELDLYFLLI